MQNNVKEQTEKAFYSSALPQFRDTDEIKQKAKDTGRKLTTKQIEGYLKKSGKQILQSVGCYQLEALGPQIIKDIKGDFF